MRNPPPIHLAWLDLMLRRALLGGLALVALFPAARGHSEWAGWAPLWLVGMPASALWALHRFQVAWPPLRLPARRGPQAVRVARRMA